MRGGTQQSSASGPSNPFRPSHPEVSQSPRSTCEAQVTQRPYPANRASLMSQDGRRARAYQPGHGKRYQTQTERSKFGQRGSKILKSGDGNGKIRDGVNPTLKKKTV